MKPKLTPRDIGACMFVLCLMFMTGAATYLVLSWLTGWTSF